MNTFETEFETIKKIREWRKDLPASKVSEKTTAEYKIEYARILKKSGNNFGRVLESARDTTSSSTWYRRRAAAKILIVATIDHMLKEQDYMQRSLKTADESHKIAWQKKIKLLEKYSDLYQDFETSKPLPKIPPLKKRSGQKKSLAGLPQDWRESLAKRLPKYRAAFLIAAATGCRPAELVTGVAVKIENGEIFATIAGAKTTEHAGQISRTIKIALDEVDGSIATQLAELIGNHGVTRIGIENEKLFSGAIRDAARREWKSKKTDLSAYSLRHQFASDRKNENWAQADVSAMLGHSTEKTASYYGVKTAARGGFGAKITGVDATRKVKKIKKIKIK